ncbi:hypothetical protein NDU88_003510 [Pleurodeles waltl]|uniref:Secreted protein n=1 Tax=Pleurodeles waltl TaxID=8319 RepID=A0AAV7UFD8_PLEWA|nr:hypothetical protein NDU88_003510 [Pleurodeles waltl]
MCRPPTACMMCTTCELLSMSLSESGSNVVSTILTVFLELVVICTADLTYPKQHWGRVREILSPDMCHAVLQDLSAAVGAQLINKAPPPGFTRVPA